ncbi:hypothetical protein KY289_037028 [Solanum tuberosum]|nr:hypothetical protein KY289_037028 [Solanum tuberosum]
MRARAGKGTGTGIVGRDKGRRDGRGTPLAGIRPGSRLWGPGLAGQKYVPSRPTIYTGWDGVWRDGT